MKGTGSTAVVLGLLGSVLTHGHCAQSPLSPQESDVSLPRATRWCDAELSAVVGTQLCWSRHIDLETDTSWSYLFPSVPSPDGEPMTEFIGVLSAPASAGWIGNSLGGSSTAGHEGSHPLIIGWLDSYARPMASVRHTSLYLPLEGAGPVVTVLESHSGLTSTGHLRIIYRCQNCTSWEGNMGAIDLDGANVFSFSAHSTSRPSSPGNPSSGVEPPSLEGKHVLDVPDAKSSSYWGILKALERGPL